MTVTERLALYQQALDDIVLGKRVAEVTVDGERVRFSDANIDQLKGLVDQARSAVKAEQIASKRKQHVYWSYGGRE